MQECHGMLGPSVSRESSIARIGKSIGPLSVMTARFDQSNGIPRGTGKHSRRSVAKDMDRLLKQLHKDSKVFEFVRGRCHKSFPKFQQNSLRVLKQDEIVEQSSSKTSYALTHIYMYQYVTGTVSSWLLL